MCQWDGQQWPFWPWQAISFQRRSLCRRWSFHRFHVSTAGVLAGWSESRSSLHQPGQIVGISGGWPGWSMAYSSYWSWHILTYYTVLYICMYIYMCVCVCVYVYIYIYIHMCVYKYVFFLSVAEGLTSCWPYLGTMLTLFWLFFEHTLASCVPCRPHPICVSDCVGVISPGGQYLYHCSCGYFAGKPPWYTKVPGQCGKPETKPTIGDGLYDLYIYGDVGNVFLFSSFMGLLLINVDY